ncbi:MAG: ATP-dependent zinc protease [Phycisphaerales bacterium JB039]
MTPHPDPPALSEPGQPVLGWRERVAIPSWGVRGIRAKIDTGARTSAIHVTHIEPVDADRVRFEVVTRERPARRTVTVEAGVVRWTSVRPSSGDAQQRPVVSAAIRIGPVRRTIEVSLVSREGMLCRMLIGRRALEGLLVDPSMRYRLTPRLPGPRKPTA